MKARATIRFWTLGLVPASLLVVALASGAGLWRRHAAAAEALAQDATRDRLHALDAERRHAADFAKLPTWDRQSGPDPYALQELPGTPFLIGILRGADAVVVLDGALREVQRLPASRSPTALALALADDGDTVFVAGELANGIARYRWHGGALAAAGTAALPDVHAVRGLATGPGGWLYLVEEQRGRLVALRISDAAGGALSVVDRHELAIGHGPVRVERVGDRLIVDCLLDHALVIQKLTPDGRLAAEAPLRIVHDGPIWSFAARAAGPGQLAIAAGGAEDHPLDRTIGAFGYIDSFLYLYRVDLAARRITREAALDLSDHGVVVPKALAWAPGVARAVRVTGYGSDKLLVVTFDGGAAPTVTASALVPGTNALVERSDGTLLFADPLLDAWIEARPGGASRIVPVPVPVPVASAGAPARDPGVRLGEALVFTTLMAPWNRSEGPLSRFTCETCHFEGYVDGRTHRTGRGDVRATTKPLFGLFNNRPHFSRALDPDLVSVAFNEFRVAGARSDHDPWFDLRPRDVPWLAALGVGPEWLTAPRLREAFMTFLGGFNHRPNPAVDAGAAGRAHFSDGARAGAAVFRDRCEACHQARLSSDDADSRIPFARWEELVMTRDGPIVWGSDAYQKTGVVPYVHEEGARVPSLRRLYKKHPYFTNGSAPELAAVLARARFGKDGAFWHDDAAAPADASASALTEPQATALLAFLDLL